MVLTVYTDGGSRGNPGAAAAAFAIYKNGELVDKEGIFIGRQTNNFAEYQAVVFALQRVRALRDEGQLPDITSIQLISDSQLLVSQLNGHYKVKNAVIRDFIMKVRILEAEINIPAIYTHVMREKNTIADKLVNEALDKNRSI